MARRTRSKSAPASSQEMRQPIQPRAQATIDRICKAAMDILGEGGWDAFNINAVAARAGVAGPTVYRYFPDKYVLAAALRRRQDEAESMALQPAMELLGDRATLHRGVEQWTGVAFGLRREDPAVLLLRTIGASIPDLVEEGESPDDVVAAIGVALRRLQPEMSEERALATARAVRVAADSLVDDAVRTTSGGGDSLALAAAATVAMIETAAASESDVLTPVTDQPSSRAGQPTQ